MPDDSGAALIRAIDTTQDRWGMCLYMGTARTQNKASNHLADVRNEGGGYKVKGGRGHNTNASMDFHCDFCDVVAPLYRRAARSNDESKVVSSIALRDESARLRPDLIPVLQGPWYHSYQFAQGPGKLLNYMCPITRPALAE